MDFCSNLTHSIIRVWQNTITFQGNCKKNGQETKKCTDLQTSSAGRVHKFLRYTCFFPLQLLQEGTLSLISRSQEGPKCFLSCGMGQLHAFVVWVESLLYPNLHFWIHSLLHTALIKMSHNLFIQETRAFHRRYFYTLLEETIKKQISISKHT